MSAGIRQRAENAHPIESANGVMDHKAWAKRILERQRLGDKSLSALQISFAKEALGQK